MALYFSSRVEILAFEEFGDNIFDVSLDFQAVSLRDAMDFVVNICPVRGTDSSEGQTGNVPHVFCVSLPLDDGSYAILWMTVWDFGPAHCKYIVEELLNKFVVVIQGRQGSRKSIVYICKKELQPGHGANVRFVWDINSVSNPVVLLRYSYEC
jgi:hypothetical protein